MKLESVSIRNFRLLQDVTLCLEDSATVIVGRNNSGKTSLTELFRRIFSDTAPKFRVEDFSLSSQESFWDACRLYNDSTEEKVVRSVLPTIETMLRISYKTNERLGLLSELIIDLDETVTTVWIKITYELKDGGLDFLFKNCLQYTDSVGKKTEFLRQMQERVPQAYRATVFSVDPTDLQNQKRIEMDVLRKLIQTGFINAQRGLDDVTHKDRDVLGNILQKLLDDASINESNPNPIVLELQSAIVDIQSQIDTRFNENLNALLPTLSTFGYPGLSDPGLQTETLLDIQRLLQNHTKIRYGRDSGIGLPENYNGLGSRNLIYILFQLYQFFKSFQSISVAPRISLIFIEEPEAHLHPQMQEVFIKQINAVVKSLSDSLDGDDDWPVQAIITTHSTHLANAALFECIRYFLTKRNGGAFTEIKDLRTEFTSAEDKEFVSKYMTLTRCDLFFADKALLIEGASERLLMPKMIEKVDDDLVGRKLGSQYVTVIEVGGAYAHRFYKLLDFLELPSLVITDIDSVNENSNKCKVSEGLRTSNASIKDWFGNADLSPIDLLRKPTDEKIIKLRRIAYQVPETGQKACGRSFEDAFMLANQDLTGISSDMDEDKETESWNKAEKLKSKKTEFALRYAIEQTEWAVPLYIREGLQWLAVNSLSDSQTLDMEVPKDE